MSFQFITIPEDFECSMTSQIMIDPVFTADGETYERNAITQWLQEYDTSPKTNETLEHKSLTSNRQLKSQISSFVTQNQQTFEQELIEAARTGDIDTLELTMALGIRPNITDEQGWSAIDHAAFAGMEEIVTTLLEKQPTLTDPSAMYEQVPQLITVTASSSEASSDLPVRLLSLEIELSRIQYLCIECRRIKPVDKGSMNGSASSEYARSTFDYDLQSINTQMKLFQRLNQFTQSVLGNTMAPVSLTERIIQFEQDLNVCESEFNSVKSFYLSYNNNRTVERTQKMNQYLAKITPEINQQLMQLKQAINEIKQANTQGLAPETPTPTAAIKLSAIHLAAIKGHDEIIQALTKQHAAINQVDTQGWTPLHWAVDSNQESTVQLLLANDATVNQQDVTGMTPLHIAACGTNKAIVTLLIEHGAKADIANEQGETPATLANAQQQPEMAQWIETQAREHKDQAIQALTDTVSKQDNKIAKLEEQMVRLMQQLQLNQSSTQTPEKSATNMSFFN